MGFDLFGGGWITGIKNKLVTRSLPSGQGRIPGARAMFAQTTANGITGRDPDINNLCFAKAVEKNLINTESVGCVIADLVSREGVWTLPISAKSVAVHGDLQMWVGAPPQAKTDIKGP